MPTILMSTPKGLELDRWWTHAACKGMSVDDLPIKLCFDCPVQKECLWSAIEVDDRMSIDPIFIRGGVRSIHRRKEWYAKKRVPLEVYAGCMVQMLRDKEACRKQIKAGT